MQTVEPVVIRLADYQVPDFLIEKADLEFNLEEVYTLVNSTIHFKRNPASTHQAKNLILHGDSFLELKSINLDERQLEDAEYNLENNLLTIFNVPDTFRLEIKVRIKPQENTALTGLYKSSGNFCTQCEAHGFRRITFFLDRPDVMTKFTTKIIADEKQYPYLLSNGNLVDSGKLGGGKHFAKWEDPFKKPAYLFALVAGNFEVVEDQFTTMSGRNVVLQIFVEKGNRDKAAHAMQAVKKAMRWDETRFGREYDLDIYMIVAVSDFNMGAMENKGLNIFNTKYVLATESSATDDDFIHVESVIAHEYCHNWSGNRITCRNWFQLSLKEGLTIFRDQTFTEDTTSKTVARIHSVNVLRTQQFAEDAGPLAHPVRPDSYIEINNFYTTTIYNKGAEVIRMMQTLLGDKLFRDGMDLYFTRNDGQAVTIEEFVSAMEDASGVDLKQFRLWYSQAGTPVIDVTENYDEKNKTYSLTFTQSCPPTPGQPQKKPFHIPIKIGLLDADGKEIAVDTPVFSLKDKMDTIEFKNIKSKPIPSLLRRFSAPVKLNFNYSNADLEFLFKYDTDEFNRWEAGQKYALNVLTELMRAYQAGEELHAPATFIAAFQHVLLTHQSDKWLLAEMLMLPSEKYIAEQLPMIDVDAIHAAREFLALAIAQQLKNLFFEIYQENNDIPMSQGFAIENVGKRQLKNLALYYLMLLEDEKIINMGLQQFKNNNRENMTDTLSALRFITNIDSPMREDVLEEFYEAWKDDALVLDKWFAMQATSKLPDTLSHVKKLLKHEAFDIKNPNKVYSLIGAFAFQNPVNFHIRTGEGYKFLADLVQQIDKFNPQIAARMLVPLTNWKRYDEVRQKLMRNELEKLMDNKKLSKDVYELVSKSLE